MKFTPEQRKLIKEAREKIQNLEKEQTTLYSNLLDKLNVTDKTAALAEDLIFDYVYNSYGSIKKIESLMK